MVEVWNKLPSSNGHNHTLLPNAQNYGHNHTLLPNAQNYLFSWSLEFIEFLQLQYNQLYTSAWDHQEYVFLVELVLFLMDWQEEQLCSEDPHQSS